MGYNNAATKPAELCSHLFHPRENWPIECLPANGQPIGVAKNNGPIKVRCFNWVGDRICKKRGDRRQFASCHEHERALGHYVALYRYFMVRGDAAAAVRLESLRCVVDSDVVF